MRDNVQRCRLGPTIPSCDTEKKLFLVVGILSSFNEDIPIPIIPNPELMTNPTQTQKRKVRIILKNAGIHKSKFRHVSTPLSILLD